MQTNNVLDKYSKARLLAERTEQIAKGSPITIKDPGTNNPYLIAKMELESGKFPIKLVKKTVDGKEEVWNLKDMRIV